MITSSSTQTSMILYFDHTDGNVSWVHPSTVRITMPDAPGPLSRAQSWLWDHRLGWLGNRVSSMRYWMWKLSR